MLHDTKKAVNVVEGWPMPPEPHSRCNGSSKKNVWERARNIVYSQGYGASW